MGKMEGNRPLWEQSPPLLRGALEKMELNVYLLVSTLPTIQFARSELKIESSLDAKQRESRQSCVIALEKETDELISFCSLFF